MALNHALHFRPKYTVSIPFTITYPYESIMFAIILSNITIAYLQILILSLLVHYFHGYTPSNDDVLLRHYHMS